MSEKRANLEVIAPSVEEAVAKGLEELGLTEDAVEVEVLDAGSRGLFGLGARQARIRLKIKEAGAPTPVEIAPASAPRAETSQEAVETPPATSQVEEAPPQPRSPSHPVETVRPERQAEKPAAAQRSVETGTVVEAGTEEDDHTLRVARETVAELLEKMKVRATVTASYGEAEDDHSKVPLMVDVRGNDLSILIGPRAETLNALQYISALIVGKELGRSVPLVVDVEGYRSRRAQQLRQLARRMADQAIKTGRRQVLEPMPASERRVIHIELRSNPDVETQSIGDEPRRKVTIIPVK